ncbi:EF-hand domain-containing protein [Cellulophaga baltica]|uniref:EF-hand domain-containing protein n=1 Tax=Cellulophaga TaxID=104264 RepID=UPI001C068F27|nr:MULTISPECIES: EF-hand domain-containing protein [Cellulophaga]MBU2997091.1 EF-hand domain-containing protein [Cellulophaga baltica]MDO6768489.1 EF-hand domain-containing protein [Cellulophaga sp. 1_MG-2023]
MKRQQIYKVGFLVLSLTLATACGSKEKKTQTEQTEVEQTTQLDDRPSKQIPGEDRPDRPGPGEGQGRPTIEEMFDEMDTDDNGKLSESEVKGPLADDFSSIDNNGDGFLSEEELTNAPKPQGGGPQGQH